MKTKTSSTMLLLFTMILNSITNSYCSVWFLTIWIKCITPSVIPIKEILFSTIAFLLGMYIYKKKAGKISISLFFKFSLISELGLLFVWFSYDLTFITSVVVGSMYCVMTQAFWSNLINSNIDTTDRVRFDSISNPLDRLGSIIGGSIAYFYPLTGISVEWSLVCIYLLCDLESYLRLLLVHFGVLKYDK